MKLKSKPRDDSNSMFVKFNEIGDTITGEFVEYIQDSPSRFGDESVIHLKNDDGPKVIRCPKKLKAIVEDNLDQFVVGATVTITFCAEIPTNKGNPMKDFDVDVEPPKTKGKRDEDTPF